MKLINLAWKLQQHQHGFYQMHLCCARDPAQAELVQALGTQNSLNKFALLTMKYVYAILMFITKVNG